MCNENSRKKIIVVLGMHRSGTSAITRSLKAIGINLGGKFVPTAGDNERGFWEDSDIVAFNDVLLSKLGYQWYGNTVIGSLNWDNDIIKSAKQKAIVMLEEKLLQSGVFAFKDPRTAVLIEFWMEVFRDLNLSISFLIALRNPLDVAESLFKRNQLPRDKSLLLWTASVVQSINFTKNEACLVVSYDDMLHSPVEQLSRISSVFDLPPVDEESEAVLSYCHDFLTKDLKHNNNSDVDLYQESSVPSVVRDVYFFLRKVASDEIKINSKEFDSSWITLGERFRDITPLLKSINLLESEKESLNLRLDVKQVELDSAISEIDHLSVNLK